ncbi:MAG: hypothetical protein AAF546_07590 [Verrucomicrobiota bacterium]
MKTLASLILLLICVGCQTNTYNQISEMNAARDFEDGNYRIFRYGFAAHIRTKEEKRMTDQYGIVFVAVAGDVIPTKLNLEKVREYNLKMTELLNEKLGIDLDSELEAPEAEPVGSGQPM